MRAGNGVGQGMAGREAEGSTGEAKLDSQGKHVRMTGLPGMRRFGHWPKMDGSMRCRSVEALIIKARR